MNKTSRLIAAAIGGLGAGFAIAFILCVATSVVAISTDATATLPGVFTATAGSENGALALEFKPSFLGIAAVVCLTALINVLVAMRGGNHGSSGHR